MNEINTDAVLGKLANLIRQHDDGLTFTMLEIGAVPVGDVEPFHRLLDHFPGSRVIAFEVDPEVCEKLNRESRPEMRFFAAALGRAEEKRAFHETEHPMCSSLYEPNSQLLSLYNNLQFANLKSVKSIDTVSLDRFAADNRIGPVDFIKIDIQGAELDVFQGGGKVLSDVVAIVSEVEFIPHYLDQPLFGDVCAHLRQQDIMFHKFLTRGRVPWHRSS